MIDFDEIYLDNDTLFGVTSTAVFEKSGVKRGIGGGIIVRRTLLYYDIVDIFHR